MKRKSLIRFLAAYLIFAFLSVFTLASFSSDLVRSTLLDNEAETLNREGTVLSSRYGTEAFENGMNLYRYEHTLDAFSTFLHASIWIVNRTGDLIASAGDGYTAQPPETIADFDPTESSSPSYLTGDFHGLFDEDVLTVSCPITNGFRTLGYVIIHLPLSGIDAEQAKLTRIGLLSFAIIFLFSLIILGTYILFIQHPLRKIIRAAKEYADGNLGYQIEISHSGEIGQLAAALNDMSDRLNKSEENQKKFIANVSHDFRSPLTSIKGYVEAMQDGTIPPELMEKYLGIISFETERLTDLTEDLLTLSSYDLKGTRLTLENFNLNEVIKNTAESFEGRCVKQHIEFQLLFADYTTIVRADLGKIQQVFYNLIDNAVKFSPDNSTITVETTIQGNKVRISVKDRGIGIPKKDIAKIWDRFYKGDASRGRDKKGTGLGLAIVKEVIQAHGETVSVVSTEGTGTEFIFTLPLARGVS